MKNPLRFTLPLLLTSTLLFSAEPSENEALAARRIVSFYQDKNYPQAQSQIALFLQTYPQSDLKDQILLLDGLILQASNNHLDAIQKFKSITKEEQKKSAHIALLNSYRALGYRDKIIAEGNPEIAPLIVAEALYDLGNYDEAEHILIDRQELDAKFLIGKVLIAKGEYKLASNLFMELSKFEPRKNEALLLASMAQAKFLPGLALKTLQNVSSGEGILLQAKLLIDMGRADEVIANASTQQQSIDPTLKPRLQYFLARAYYAKRDFPKVIEVLQPLVDNLQDNPIEGKGAILTLISAADAMELYPQLDQWCSLFHQNYPNEPERAQVFYLQASSATKQGNPQAAISLYNQLLTQFPHFPAADSATYQKILLLSSTEQFDQAKSEIQSFPSKFPKSSISSQTSRLLPQILLKQFYALPPENPAREEIIAELQQVIQNGALANVYSDKELFRYTLALAHMQKGARHTPEAITLMQNILDKITDESDLLQAHELLASCYLDGKPDYPSFIYHTDQLLSLTQDSKKLSRYHFNLFSAYIQFAKEIESSSPEEKDRYLTNAADSLDHVLALGELQIPTDHLLWLGNWHEQHLNKEACELLYNPLNDDQEIAHAEKGVRAFSKAFSIETDHPLEIDPKTINKEGEIIKLAQMLGWLKRYKQELALLEKLTTLQQDNPSWGWHHAPLALYTLGHTHQILENTAKAQDIYHKILETRQGDPAILAAAGLQLARIDFSNIPPENRTKDNPDLSAILAKLKDLMTRKSLVQEPIHLEAGFAYAQIKASLDQDDPQKRLLEELRSFKAQFAHKTDLWAKDYHHARTLHPDKDAIYQAYMMLADGQINYLQIHLKDDLNKQNDVRYEAAKTIFKTLLEGKYALTNYLVDEARRSLEAMEQNQAIALPQSAPITDFKDEGKEA